MDSRLRGNDEGVLDAFERKPVLMKSNTSSLSYTHTPMLPAARNHSALSQPWIIAIL